VNARIDPLRGEIGLGERTFRFRLDCRADAAVVRIGEREYRVRPLEWREKARLSRYASLGDARMTRELVHLCADLGEDESVAPDTEAVLVELTRWINDPSGYTPGLPFDADSVAAVTLQLCRATHLRPVDFDARGAWEVEAMWKAVATDTPEESVSDAGETSAMTRIVIVPDPEPAGTEARTVEAEPTPVVSERVVESASPAAVPAPVTPRFRVVNPADALNTAPRGSHAAAAPIGPITPTPPEFAQALPVATADRVRVTSAVTVDPTRDVTRATAGISADLSAESAAIAPPTALERDSESLSSSAVSGPRVRASGVEPFASFARSAVAAPLAAKAVTQAVESPVENDASRPDPSVETYRLPFSPALASAASPDVHAWYEHTRLNAVTPLAAAPHQFAAPPIDREALFDELADRVAEAAADMGIEV
jgi:hypothetical protein